MPPLVSRITFTVVASLVLGALAGCSTAPQIGELRKVNGGTQIVVPALWADGASGTSGIEPATVWVDPTRTSDQLAYEVNLVDVQAKGGGAMWQAATSSAAAIGTLFSGLNPDNVACKFDITGPIDGPSAGGILTIGVLAALNRHPLDPSVTMTGTISPDGSLGPVGLIPLKLQAAADEGYETVLLPAALTTVSDPLSGAPVQTDDYANTLGIEVQFVRTIDEAYERFTGERLAADSEAGTESAVYSFTDFAALDQARSDAAEQLQADVTARLIEAQDAPQQVRDQLDGARSVSLAGDVNAGFALAVDALEVLESWRGSTEFELMAAASGVPQARKQLRDDVIEQHDAINQQLAQALSVAADFDPAQSLAFPGAVAWLTYARAIFVSLEQALTNPALDADPKLLADYAGLAAQVVAESEAVFPASMLVLGAVPETTNSHTLGQNASDVNDFVSGYTNFLVAAGDANLTYLREVAGLSPEQQSQLPVTDLVPVALALADEAAGIDPGTQDIETELEQSSVAMTYFVVTTSLVSSEQVFGSADMWLNPEQAKLGANAYVSDSIAQSGELTSNSVNELIENGFNAGFPLWSAEWGTAAFEQLSAQERDATGASIALNELWYDVITVLSMRAFVTPE